MHEFDLEKRTTNFAKRVIRLCHALPKNSMNNRLIGQIVGSSGSIGANYREANDSLGKNDFLMRIKISRREAKESLHWLELISEANPSLSKRMIGLHKECNEIKNILSSIIQKQT
jgi:four helix bundle protein